MSLVDTTSLFQLSRACLLELSDDQGIAASARSEAYGCIFGRDSAITILKIINVLKRQTDPELVAISQRTLYTLVQLQGKEYNLESGEEPGKFIHEFRTNNYERLINRPRPWFVYPDGILRNYDSVDSTPLGLIALYRFYKATGDEKFLLHVLSAVENGLKWIMTDADKDKDYLVEYELPVTRKSGGLVVQSWTDSHNCLTDENGVFPEYPIAAIEVQAFCWLALREWADYFETDKPDFALTLRQHALEMKRAFNKYFVFLDTELYFGAQAVTGKKHRIRTVTANPLLCLWASYKRGEFTESILEDQYISDFVQRAFQPDMFHPQAGIRTMSTASLSYDPSASSYHNGSFWPMLNGLIHEGLTHWGFEIEAEQLAQAMLKPIQHFNSPIELYTIDDAGNYFEYISLTGKKGCRQQAWSAAAVLDLVTTLPNSYPLHTAV